MKYSCYIWFLLKVLSKLWLFYKGYITLFYDCDLLSLTEDFDEIEKDFSWRVMGGGIRDWV